MALLWGILSIFPIIYLYVLSWKVHVMPNSALLLIFHPRFLVRFMLLDL